MIYDWLDNTYKEIKTVTKTTPKTEIYTGVGSVYEVRLGKCEDLIKDIKDESIHAVISDPPFKVAINKDWDLALPSKEFFNELYRVLKPGGHLVFFGQSSRIPEVCAILNQTDFQFRDMITWNHPPFFPKGYKTDDKTFRSKVRTGYTPIFIYRKKLNANEGQNWEKYRTNLLAVDDCRMPYKGDHSSIVKKFERTGKKHQQSQKGSNTYGDKRGEGWIPDSRGCVPSNAVYCSRPTKDERTINNQIENTHETLKPIALMVFLTKLFTNSSDQKILDPWAGSGTGGMAARYVGRPYIGFEMDSKHVEVAKFRIKHVFDLDTTHFNKLTLV